MAQLRYGLMVIALGSALALPARAETSNVTLHNNSSFAIHHMFLSPDDEAKWGPDQLGTHVVESGEAYELSGIPCDDYDLKLVDEDGDECVVEVPAICGGNEDWKVEDPALLECEGYGSGEGEGDEDGGDDEDRR